MYDSNNQENNEQPQVSQQTNQQPVQQPYNYYGQAPQYSFTTKPPKKKKPFAAAIAIICAVAVVGMGSGFGGAYLANSLNSAPASQPAQTSEADGTAAPDSGESALTTPEYVKPDVAVADDLSTLNNTVSASNGSVLTAETLYEKVNKSIVVINNYRSTSSGGYSGTATGDIALYATGSGIIITTDGYILTNAHVVSGAAKVSVVINDDYGTDQEIEAVVVGSDSATDLAVLKVSRTEAFTAVPLGDSDSVKIGQTVCAIGNPSGLAKTITMGIISGLNRYTSEDSGYELSSIQTDTAINPGNSGGGLFDMYGNVIGVVNSKIVSQYTENLGFAITINEAKPVISDLINYGYVKGRVMLGITTSEISEYTAYLYGFTSAGLLVTTIDESAPVAKSQLRTGDVITAINGTAVTSVSAVQSVIKGMNAGDTVTLTVERQTSGSDSNSFGWGYSSSKTETLTIDIQLTVTD